MSLARERVFVLRVLLLMLAGDIETNRGPNSKLADECVLQPLIRGHKEKTVIKK